MSKKILFVTVDCWSAYNSATTANTFETLFKNYDAKNLAGVCLREEIPTSTKCSSYFVMSENAVLKSIFKSGTRTGKHFDMTGGVTTEEVSQDIEATKKRYAKFGEKRRRVFLYAREMVWILGKWKSPEFKKFLDDFKPDVVIYGMEGYGYFHSIVRYILKRTKAEGYGYFWDDHFSYKTEKKTLGYIIQRTIEILNLKKTAKMSKGFFAISPKTKKEVDVFFKTDCTVLTKPIEERKNDESLKSPSERVKVLYTGNLKIGRLDTLKLISDVLDEDEELSEKFEFLIYSGTQITNAESFNDAIKFMGSVPQHEIAALQEKADILLLVEDVMEKGLVARLSFSTKTTDYLSQGKCILAIGNMDLSSMEYLKETDGALIAHSKETIKSCLIKISEKPEILEEYGEKAYQTGIKNHSREIMEERLRKVIGY